MEAFKRILPIIIWIGLSGCFETGLTESNGLTSINATQSTPYNFQFNIPHTKNTPTSIHWNFGDGYQAKGNNVAHRYTSPGMYSVTASWESSGKVFEDTVQIEINGDFQSLLIQPQHPFAIDSDHNDPNQVTQSNDIEPQVLPNPIRLSGILMAKNHCQAGHLCENGDLLDQYAFNIKYGDQLKLTIIKGSINLDLHQNKHVNFAEKNITSELTIPSYKLIEGEYQLQLSLPSGETHTQYIIEITQHVNIDERAFQPGKLIVNWEHSNYPELIDISDPRLISVDLTQGKPNIQQAKAKLQMVNPVKSVSLNYYRNAYSTDSLTWPLIQQKIEQLWTPLLSRGHIPGSHSTVAVLDSGVYFQHNNFTGTTFRDGYDFVSDPLNSGDHDGWDSDPSDPGDRTLSYHGTHVTGIIAAQPSDQNKHIQGIAWGADIMPLRVLGKNGGTSYDLIQALRYAAGLPNDSGKLPSAPADIINLSLGGPQFSIAEHATIQEVIESGAIVVAAAGNQGAQIINFPAGYKNVISVGASNIFGQIADYSNYGAFIDVIAPGGECTSATCLSGVNSLSASGFMNQTLDTRQATWKNMSGTSMASAHVSGLLAIARSQLPALDAYEFQKRLKLGEFTDGINLTGFDETTGWGRLSSHKILELIDSSPLDSGHAWTSKTDVYLQSGQAVSIPIILRGNAHNESLSISFDSNVLTASIEKQTLNIEMRSQLASTEAITLYLNERPIKTLYAHANIDSHLPIYNPHLYLEMLGDGQLYSGLRTTADKDAWTANIPPLQTGQTIQASTDIDYDGVYCEMGEFCAQSNNQYLISGSGHLDSGYPIPLKSNLKINGSLIGR